MIAPDGRVRLVWDASALTAYTGADVRGVQVGELAASVKDNGDLLAIPALVLLAVLRRCHHSDRELLREFAFAGDPVVVSALSPGAAVAVARFSDTWHLSGAQRDHAVFEAISYGCMLATYEPGLYKGMLDDEDILEL